MTAITNLERRTSALEGEVAGEKIVTRHILEQLRANTEIMLEMRKELASLAQKVDRIGDRVALTEAHLTSLAAKLPTIIADTMREVLNDSRKD